MAESTERLVFELFARDRDASRTFDKVGRAADKAGDDIEGMGKDAKNLDKQIGETRGHLKDLIREFEQTGDKELFKGIRKDRSTLSLLESMRKELKGAQGQGLALGEILKGLPSQLKGAAIVGAVGIGATIAPALGAAVGGAVLGAVGAGGIIGGIALAAQDSRVQRAGSELGEHLLGGLKGAGTPFIAPLLAEMGTLRRAGDAFTDDLESGFKRLAPLVRPLAHGLEGMVDALGPGLGDAFAGAQPVIRALANELPEIGDAIGDMFSAIADEGDGATEGMIALLHATEGAARATGYFIGQLEWEFNALVNLGDKLDEFKEGPLGILTSNLGFGFNYLTDQADEITESLDQANDVSGDFNTTVVGLARAMEDGAQAAEDLKDAFNDLFGKTMSLDQAQLNYKKSIDETLAALKEGKRTLSENTVAGQENVAAVLEMIRSIEDLRSANVDNGMTVAEANKQYETQLDRLRNTLLALGFNKKAVDEMVGAYKKIPAEVATQVSAPGLGAAYAKLLAYVELLGDAEGHRKFEFSQYREGERNPSGKRAAGGPVMAGNTYWVGERGPELVTFGHNGTVIPAGQSAAMAGGGSAPVVKVELNFPAFTGDPIFDAFLRRLREGVTVEGSGSVSAYFGGAAA